MAISKLVELWCIISKERVTSKLKPNDLLAIVIRTTQTNSIQL